ncbi:hypothetical protein GOV08_03835 [Candidatus Woesearchaeota archaeon]|nr:hypothetical protein [Candidatus Woesearchaeota archaeon]
MARVIYDIQEEKIEEEVIEPNFLLTNKKGGYFLDHKDTKYRGLCTLEMQKKAWDLLKSVDTLSISQVPSLIKYHLWGIEKKHGKASEKLFFYNNSLMYEVDNYKGNALLTLDIRYIHDFATQGQKYTISEENNFVIVKFKKGKEFVRYLAIKSDAPIKKLNRYKDYRFRFDEKRKSAPFSFPIYEALLFQIKGNCRISISVSKSKEEAMNEANYIYYSHHHLKSQKEKELIILFRKKKISRKIKTAYKCSIKALDDLYVEIDGLKGFYAGLPWFFQIWARDEAISLGGLINEKRHDLVKNILLRQTSKILADGRTPNKTPFSALGTADGVGWVFKSFGDVFYSLQRKKQLSNYWNDGEISVVTSRLKDSIEKILRYYVRKNLTINRKKETWMDTDVGNDPRDGARIEIQALTLNMLKVAKDLCLYIDDPDFTRYEALEKEMRKKVRSLFFNNGTLYDGHNDPTIRPNVFLAYYIYPELLKRKEWKQVFRNTLFALWLKWGGVSTIDKTNPLFLDEYTGMEDRSYHRGDSWYFVNNIAAMCLHKVDRRLFSRYIKDIVKASTEDILRLGAIGCASELSSAKEQRAEGSISQAWSSSTYVAMINELFG